jgi:NAD(P)-dependent dehydrogenase (short-subunit alcohol dehydrogenase family)
MARISLLQEESASEEFQETFKQVREKGGRVLNIFKLMAHSPQVGVKFMRLGNAILFKGIVSPCLRELAILRVGHLCGSKYEWTQHVNIALRVGVRQAQIDNLPDWEHSGEFSETEKAILRYTDECTINIRVTDKTFAAVRTFLNEEGILELTTAIGYYGKGVIVNIIGAAGERPRVEYIAGGAGNAALMAFTRALGARSMKDGIRVVAVNPGLIKTERLETLLKSVAQSRFNDPERWPELIPKDPPPGEPQDVAKLVAFLVSDCAKYITGTIVTVDGGVSAS